LGQLGDLAYNAEAVASFCKRWGISELALFGSAARDELRPDSDVDVMVRFSPDTSPSVWDLVTMRDALGEIFGRPVDLLEAGSVKNPIRKQSIERDLTIIYAA
jgi:predicted nucleotidyltransferase